MNPWLALLAQLEIPKDVTKAWHTSNGTSRELMALFAAIGVVTFILLIWVVYFRKSERRKRSTRHRDSRPRGAAEPGKDGGAESNSPRRRKRRHRTAPMNPTLAQTGGLPPARVEAVEPETAPAE